MSAADKVIQLPYAAFMKNSPEIRRLQAIANDNGLVLCPCESGLAVLGRADSPIVVERLQQMAFHHSALFCVCVSDLATAWKCWLPDVRNSKNEEMLSIFWPGPLAVTAPAAETVPSLVKVGRKVTVWQPGSQVLRSLLKNSGLSWCCCLFAEDFTTASSPQSVVAHITKICSPWLKAQVAGRQVGNLHCTEVDISGLNLRLTKPGSISVAELEQTCQTRLILSGDSLGTRIDEQIFAARLILFEGEPERLARRISHHCENLDIHETIVFLTASEQLNASLNKLLPIAGSDFDFEIVDMFATSELCHSQEVGDWQNFYKDFIERLRTLRSRDEVRLVVVEAPCRCEYTEEILEKMARLAHQVISTDRLGNGSLLTADVCD